MRSVEELYNRQAELKQPDMKVSGISSIEELYRRQKELQSMTPEQIKAEKMGLTYDSIAPEQPQKAPGFLEMLGGYTKQGIQQFDNGLRHSEDAFARRIFKNTPEETQSRKLVELKAYNMDGKSEQQKKQQLKKNMINNALAQAQSGNEKSAIYRATHRSEMSDKELLENAAALEEKNKNANEFSRGAAQMLGNGAGNILPSMALNKLVPGAGLFTSGLSTGGNAYHEAIQDGATEKQALLTGALTGGTSAGLEKLFGGMPGFGKGKISFDKMIESGIKGAVKQGAVKWAVNSLGEGIEEGVEALIQPQINKLVYGKEIDLEALPGEVLSSTIGGTALGALFGGARDITNGVKSKNSISKAANIQADNALIEEALAKADGKSDTAKNSLLSKGMQGINSGLVTTIKAPYEEKTPINFKASNVNSVDIPNKVLSIAATQIKAARKNAAETNTSMRNYLTKFYKNAFEQNGGARQVKIQNVRFDDSDYIVDINKNSVNKVISDKNLTSEKLAVLNNIDKVLINSNYVGSGKYVQHGNTVKNTVRFDYFEAPVKIGGKDCIASIDVEVFPSRNNYRTHKVIDKISLTEVSHNKAENPLGSSGTGARLMADTAPVAAAKNQFSAPDNNIIPQSGNYATNVDEIRQGYTEGKSVPQLDNSRFSVRGKNDFTSKTRTLSNNVARQLFVKDFEQNKADRLNLQSYIEGIAYNEIATHGKLRPETRAALYDDVYSVGIAQKKAYVKSLSDFYRFFRNNRILARTELRDKYPWLTSVDGAPINEFYISLSAKKPQAFPSSIKTQEARLERINAVLKAYADTAYDLNLHYADRDGAFKRDGFKLFDEKLDDYEYEVRGVPAYERSRREQIQVAQGEQPTVAQVLQAYDDVKQLTKESYETMGEIILSPLENKLVELLLDGEMQPADLLKQSGINSKNVLTAYNVKRDLKNARAVIDESKHNVRAKHMAQAETFTLTSDSWQDKKKGIFYSTETMERNVTDIIPTSEMAKQINDFYFKKIHENEALATKLKNRVKKLAIALNLNEAESTYTQILGELRGVEAARQMGVNRSDTEIEQLTMREAEHRAVYGNEINFDKVDKAVKLFNMIYKELFDMINEANIKNGEAPLEFRFGYFPHTPIEKTDTLFKKVAKTIGFDIRSDNLPTEIAGRTHQFKPNKRYNPFAKQRTGFETEYNALLGLDKYLEVAADIVFHTEDIKKLRAFATSLRLKHGTEGTKARMKEIYNNKELTESEKYDLISAIKPEKGHLSNFVTQLDEYTNNLAGKKALSDRGMEYEMGRWSYQAATAIESRIAANMVALNPGTWLTNLIPITQATAECSTGSLVRAAAATLKGYTHNDGFNERSVFLTNREGSATLSRTALQRAGDFLSTPMQIVDMFTSEIVTRAKYYDNIKTGMTQETAMDNADAYAARLIADRSKGALPTIFNKKNPLIKAFTMFQVEANNQIRYLVKDLPKAKQEGVIDSLSWSVAKYMLGAFLYNELYEKLIGRRPALDGLGIIGQAVSDFKNEDISIKQAGANLFENMGEQVPFVGGVLFDGGRLPINSALPNPVNLWNASADFIDGNLAPSTAAQRIGKELAKPATYILPPFGGGSVKKAIEGTDVLLKGGSYTKDKDGRDKLRFAVENPSLGEVVSALLFGPYSTKGGRNYIDSGFKTMSADHTEQYKKALALGVSGDIYRDFLSKEKELRADKNEKGNVIAGSKKKKVIELINTYPLSLEQKTILLNAAGYEVK